ncbi:hypothetical protein GQ43DRAFT_453152 [Delitschia confertaspora ATCC 74209]|uniref:Carbamoyl-phosphate synthase L chain, ATP binding domain protein n=1 Tax=Delitschia confertaspora ATCC 74209 TaxID=1513339 RepID=A0A9P4MZJ4_9PLEO|nr:hypothetical protein GQ43DRAFT_453152 [Delitschia confertaspora ATCC 74209]
MSNMSRPPQRPIKRLLIANRGEIATRIISSARELGIDTFAIYTPGDGSHTSRAAHAIELPSSATFMNISASIELVKKYEIDAVHPGYGFLSESAEFAKRMWEEAGAVVVGPGWEILARTGDKLKARALAAECNVPVAPALQHPTSSIPEILAFASRIGYPIMVKAVDGGGGRGIRLIRDSESLPDAVTRALAESPSRQLFAEKAAVDGFRHVEVQIIGDGEGGVSHLWERECSIQRRYQKVVEVTPSVVPDRKLISKVIEDALRMAKHINYLSLGTFEFLLSPNTHTYYFLEINPRLQVEHTITESISQTDLVKTQLLLASGANLSQCGLSPIPRNPATPPPVYSIQLRITAENVQSNWTLSIGKITLFQFPSGNGIRVDTHLVNGYPSVVSADYDSLIAKLIVTAPTWDDVVRKAQRALEDTEVVGVKTNLDVLRGITSHRDFRDGMCNTRWLETEQDELLKIGQQVTASLRTSMLGQQSASTSSQIQSLSASSSTLFRKGDAWSITLAPSASSSSNKTTCPAQPPVIHHLELTRVLRNEFPTSLSAEVLFTTPSTPSQPAKSTAYTVTLSSTTSSASSVSSSHRRGDPSDPSHVIIPFSGKLVEVLIDEGDVVKDGDVICVIQQMKMELEVRTNRSGRVVWVLEVEDGEDVGEGVLGAVVEDVGEERAKL